MVERRWVASAGWVDNVAGKTAIKLMRMIGLAAGIAQASQTAHAMWTFSEDDPRFQEVIQEARRIGNRPPGAIVDGMTSNEVRASFIKLTLNPFLKERFGDSAVLDLANEIAFYKFLREIQ
jgi:hypothetical protein